MSAAPAALWTKSRAKLNLGLRVVGRRPDGYHLLDTIFHELDLHDDVAVARTEDEVRVAVTADADRLMVPSDDRNLVVVALRRLLERAGSQAGFRVRLHKRIPNGGGLGGGSSNAAAALRMGNALLGTPLDDGALAALAAGLGADVPFFLRGGTQRGEGVGDELTPMPAAHAHFVLLSPPFGCDTAQVYKLYAELAAQRPTDTFQRKSAGKEGFRDMFQDLRNDLEPAAARLAPALGVLRARVIARGYPEVRMSGSGSTLFVAAESEGAGLRCAEDLRAAFAGGEFASVAVQTTRSAAPQAATPQTVAPQTVAPRAVAPQTVVPRTAAAPDGEPLRGDLPTHLRDLLTP